MTLQVEPSASDEPQPDAIAATLRDVTKLGGEVLVRPAGSLPNDGRVIADDRDYGA
jgi:phenylacetate-CoA ligase